MIFAGVTVRSATPADLALLDSFIRQLAREEGLPTATARLTDLRDVLFGSDAFARAVVAEVAGQPAGFALFYPKYSTVTGRRGLHLEDIYVAPTFRNGHVGQRILDHLRQLAGARGMVDLWVMHSNPAAARFYRRLGAQELDGIAVHRLDPPDLDARSRMTGLSTADAITVES